MEVRKGAEATVEINGQVVKSREAKGYRHPDIDHRIRESRTKTEHRLMKAARNAGANVPRTEMVDEYTLEIEKIEGDVLKHTVEDEPSLLSSLGENVTKLHEADIIHGDLTTSNAIVNDDKVYLIDFGLAFRSQRTEDRAVDLHLLKQVLESSHPEIAEESWNAFLEGYQNYQDSEKVIKRLEEVEKRGRYK